mmetsp:Transcript_15253/g.39662  ORF Transcript_15253/g.39662 Transcript_15253/m.39662 type:complete len:239 (+) Transcript_15253:161-877(+)
MRFRSVRGWCARRCTTLSTASGTCLSASRLVRSAVASRRAATLTCSYRLPRLPRAIGASMGYSRDLWRSCASRASSRTCSQGLPRRQGAPGATPTRVRKVATRTHSRLWGCASSAPHRGCSRPCTAASTSRCTRARSCRLRCSTSRARVTSIGTCGGGRSGAATGFPTTGSHHAAERMAPPRHWLARQSVRSLRCLSSSGKSRMSGIARYVQSTTPLAWRARMLSRSTTRMPWWICAR